MWPKTSLLVQTMSDLTKNLSRYGITYMHPLRMASQLLRLGKRTKCENHTGAIANNKMPSKIPKDVVDCRLTQYPTRGSCRPAVKSTAG